MRLESDIIFVRPGDLHIESPEGDNLRTARWMIEELNEFVQPDFVQFAGDNVQDAKDTQFEVFKQLASNLKCSWYPMVGDHDVVEDPSASKFVKHLGPTTKSFVIGGVRFIRLNTCELKPVGYSPAQLEWFERQLVQARIESQKVIVFQHHYPFKVY